MAKGQKMGALWHKEQRGGGTYLRGEVIVGGQTTRVVVFKNGYKAAGDRKPDFIIYEETQTSAAEQSAPAAPEAPGEPSPGPDSWG